MTIKIKRRIRRNIKREITTFVIVLVIIIAIFLLTVYYFARQKMPLSRSAHRKTDKLLYTMKMEKTRYSVGEPIQLIMEVRNISNKPVMLKFDKDLEYDFVVEKEWDLGFVKIPFNVWRYSASQGARDEAHTVALQPQEVITYRATWNQEDYRGKQVKKGTYVIKGTINTADETTELQMRGRMEK